MCSQMLPSLKKLLHSSHSTVHSYVKLLYTGFDAVREEKEDYYSLVKEQNQNKTGNSPEKTNFPFLPKVHLVYLFPTLVSFYVLFDSLFLIVSTKSFSYLSIAQLPSLWTHLIFPRVLWTIGDASMVFIMFMTTSIYVCLLVGEPLEERYQMVLKVENKVPPIQLFQNGKLLSVAESTQIVDFRKRAKRVGNVLVLGLFLMVNSFCVYSLLQQWNPQSIHDLLLFLVTHLYVGVATNSNINMVIYFLFSTVYLRIKQSHLGALYRKLLLQLTTLKSKQPSSKMINYTLFKKIQQFNKLQGQTTAFLNEVGGFNRFWSRYLTIFFVSYVCSACYFAYAYFFFFNDVGFFQATYFLCLSTLFILNLVALTWECSCLVYENGRSHRVATRVALVIASTSTGSATSSATLGQFFKVDSMVANSRHVNSVAFKLINGYRINSKMFQMIFSYSSILFMMICQQQSRK